jgi:hypothetical protein
MSRIVKKSSELTAVPTEYQEQVAVGKYLDKLGLLWCHVGNEREGLVHGYRMKAAGVKAGVPDILVFTPPPFSLGRGAPGVAIELKKRNGTHKDVKPRQWVWLENLMNAGWWVYVAFGALDAVRYINRIYRGL